MAQSPHHGVAMFNNITLFQFPASAEFNRDRFDEVLRKHPVKECGEADLRTMGFESLYGEREDRLLVQIGQGEVYGFCVAGKEKALIKSIFTEKKKKALEAFRQSKGRDANPGETAQIVNEVNTAMIAGTMAKPFAFECLIDFDQGWLAVGCVSGEKAEAVTSTLRAGLGSFPTQHVKPRVMPQAVMTEWLTRQQAPAPFELGETCDLVSPEGGRKWSGRKVDLAGDDVALHLEQGLIAAVLGLRMDTVTFAIDNNLRLRSINVEYEPAEEADSAGVEEFGAYALAVLTLLPHVQEHFEIEPMVAVSLVDSAKSAVGSSFFKRQQPGDASQPPADIVYTPPQPEEADAFGVSPLPPKRRVHSAP